MRFGIVSILLFVTGCTGQPAQRDAAPFPVPANSRQMIVVRASQPRYQANVAAWQLVGDKWRAALGPFVGVVGSAGIAPVGEKREGDKRTPAGTFPLGPAFGYEPTCATHLHYFQATKDDFWIDAPASPDYNRRVTGSKPACSHERLRRDDDLYRQAAVIGYNTDPVVPGRGSAIFLHNWSARNKGTDGCVALNAEEVAKLLAWLDRRSNPVIVIVP